LVSTAKNKKLQKSYYGTNGKMVKFTSFEELEGSIYEQDSLCAGEDGFEDMIINKIDAESVNVSGALIEKLEKAHPLLKIVFKFWAIDCKKGFLPFYKYLSDERVLRMAVKDEKCAKYVLKNMDGREYINPSTASKMLYKFQSQLTKDDVREVVRLGTDFKSNPYLVRMLEDVAV
jgi:hypothetical protein